MNKVIFIGHVVRDPDIRETKVGTKVASFTLAINRGKDKDGNDMGADFPSIIAFGRLADVIERYAQKGKQLCVAGKVTTGSYEGKDGKKVYTTDFVAEQIELLGSSDRSPSATKGTQGFENIPNDVEDEGLPFN